MGTLALWELWAEMVSKDESLADPVLFESFKGGRCGIFDGTSDDNLKTILSKIKALLNDGKSREKGAVVLDEFILAIGTKRLMGVQDGILSAIRVVCSERNLKSVVVRKALGNLLPACKNLPDVVKELTGKTGYIGKILAVCEEELLGGKPSPEVFKLLEVCLKNFKGSCGSHRDKLEKSLMLFLDGEMRKGVCEIFPLLSQTGGAGKGDGYSKDWLRMIKRFLEESYNCLEILYGDISGFDEENPFGGENDRDPAKPFLPQLKETQVFPRIVAVKKRLENLISVVSAYLRKPFPSPKPVPCRSVIKLLGYIIWLNPKEIMGNQNHRSRKEMVFLATILPGIHESAFKLLNALVSSLGTNILTETTAVEQLFTQQLRWMGGTAYSDLKQIMYSSLVSWLSMSRGQVSNPKTVSLWAEYFLKEIRLEKEAVELKLQTKKKNKQASSFSSGIEINSGINFHDKNSKTVELALEILIKLLQSLDPVFHKEVYYTAARTQIQIYQEASFPSQYESASCRMKLNELLHCLAVTPNAQSSISLGLIVNLLKRACLDSSKSVSKFCQNSLSFLERLVHPSCQSLDFPSNFTNLNSVSNVDYSSVIVNNMIRQNEALQIETEESIELDQGESEPKTETADIGCQTQALPEEKKEVLSDNEAENPPSSHFQDIMRELKYLKEEFGKFGQTSSSSNNQLSIASFSREEKQESLLNEKRHVSALNEFEDEVDDDNPTKKQKKSNPSTFPSTTQKHNAVENYQETFNSQELQEMFNDFVDEGPEGPHI